MEPVTDSTSSVRALRGHTIAIWVLAILTLLNTAILLYWVFLPALLLHHMNEGPSITSSFDYAPSDEFAKFRDWPIEKQIDGASVIAITTYKKEDGKLKSMITAIPKQRAGTEFSYKVGDEYAHATRYPRENTSYGEGEVMFFTGSPATMRFSASYENGRIYGMGDLPLQKLTDLVAREK